MFQPCPESPCCDLECGGAPEVKWCPAYAAAQGLIVPIVPNPALCIYMDYGCCRYVLTNVIPNPGGVCPTGGGVWNVGTFYGTRTINPNKESCCDAVEIPVPDTCVWNDAYPSMPPSASFCLAYVFEPYTNFDQWGIVPSKPVTVTSTLTYCYATFGAQSYEACDNCPPIDHYQSKVTHAQEIGYCIPFAVPSECPGQRNYVQVEYLTCAECNPCGACCGGSDPCEGVDPNADFCEDPSQSFTIKTCYSVNPCLDANDDPIWFEQDVLTITYDFCSTVVDPDDPNALALLTALFAGGGIVNPWDADTVWGGADTGISISLCPGGGFSDPTVYVFSGDAKDIANAINSLRVNFPWLRADASEVWGECFWFGVRQTCDNCPGDPPGTRPAYGAGGQDGDQLVFDRIEIIDSTRFRAIFRGRSKKHYVCAAQTLESIHSVTTGCAYNDTDVVNLAVSATGSVEDGFALHCLSPAEYACGDRYTMQQIEQDYCSTTICSPDFPGGQTVTGCEAVTGYPLYDVVVEGVTVLEGWTSLCGGGIPSMPAVAQFRCRSYPWQYQVTPCGQIPPGGTCEPGVYQSAAAYCETEATTITVT